MDPMGGLMAAMTGSAARVDWSLLRSVPQVVADHHQATAEVTSPPRNRSVGDWRWLTRRGGAEAWR